MTNKFESLSLQEGLEIWGRNRDISVPAEEQHIPAAELLCLAISGGWQAATEDVRHHLSRCSICLENWFAACLEQAKTEKLLSDSASDDWFSGGLLEAAAGAGITSPLQLQSSCGHFRLNLYPDAVKQGAGMVTLEYVGSGEPNPEGRFVVVKDRLGVTFLKGVIRGGRVARLSELFKKIDLQSWSLQVHGTKPEQVDD